MKQYSASIFVCLLSEKIYSWWEKAIPCADLGTEHNIILQENVEEQNSEEISKKGNDE